jgi:hypothetical protein
VAIVDEAAFVKTPLLTEGIFPVTITKEKACVIMPTTPGKRNSYFMNLIALKAADGKPRMPLIRVGQPCRACMKTSEPWCVCCLLLCCTDSAKNQALQTQPAR